MISRREHQTQGEIAALRDNMTRVGLIIVDRWLLVLTLIVYSVIGFSIHLRTTDFFTLLEFMIIPANAVLLVIIYNYFFSIYKAELANIEAANFAQLLMDVIIVAVLVYYSGGPHSWFWVIYVLIVFQMATIAEKRSDVWRLVGVIIALITIINWGVYLEILPHVAIPLSSSTEYQNINYSLLRYLWQATIIVGAGLVSVRLMFNLRASLTASRNNSIIDEMTGLYSREYFRRVITNEVSRANYYSTSVFAALIDIDNFRNINKYFGVDVGDEFLGLVSDLILEELQNFSEGSFSSNIVARYSGEEFALMIVENPQAHDNQPTEEDVEALLERIKARISEMQHLDVSVTVSIGFAGMPKDALDAEELMARADEALAYSIMQGGNELTAYRGGVFIEELDREFSTAPLENISKYLDE